MAIERLASLLRQALIVCALLSALGLAACGGDDCGGSGDCGDGQVCAECATATGTCNRCVDSGEVSVCTCL